MTLRAAPEIKVSRPATVQAYEPSPQLMDRWQSGLRAADAERSNVISVLDVIGEDWWSGEGVTAKRISAALRSIKEDEVIVDINSPGGDFFEGVAIYNMLRQDERKITVRVLGLAASSASVIAMAGDQIEIASTASIMVHNCWCLLQVNQYEARSAADLMAKFDTAMAEVYAQKSSVTVDQAMGWMRDKGAGGSYFRGSEAVAAGLADRLLDADLEIKGGTNASALRRVDTLLAKQNVSRSERRALLAEITGSKPGAAAPVTPGADDEMAGLLRSMIKTLNG